MVDYPGDFQVLFLSIHLLNPQSQLPNYPAHLCRGLLSPLLIGGEIKLCQIGIKLNFMLF